MPTARIPSGTLLVTALAQQELSACINIVWTGIAFAFACDALVVGQVIKGLGMAAIIINLFSMWQSLLYDLGGGIATAIVRQQHTKQCS